MTDTDDYFSNILDLCDGDKNIVLEISADMHRLFAEEMTHADQCLCDGNFDALAKIAHRLRSAVVNFRMDTAAALLSDLENMRDSDNNNGAADILAADKIIALLKTEVIQFERAYQRLRSTTDESL